MRSSTGPCPFLKNPRPLSPSTPRSQRPPPPEKHTHTHTHMHTPNIPPPRPGACRPLYPIANMDETADGSPVVVWEPSPPNPPVPDANDPALVSYYNYNASLFAFGATSRPFCAYPLEQETAEQLGAEEVYGEVGGGGAGCCWVGAGWGGVRGRGAFWVWRRGPHHSPFAACTNVQSSALAARAAAYSRRPGPHTCHRPPPPQLAPLCDIPAGRRFFPVTIAVDNLTSCSASSNHAGSWATRWGELVLADPPTWVDNQKGARWARRRRPLPCGGGGRRCCAPAAWNSLGTALPAVPARSACAARRARRPPLTDPPAAAPCLPRLLAGSQPPLTHPPTHLDLLQAHALRLQPEPL
jgi:hypothetical protein